MARKTTREMRKVIRILTDKEIEVVTTSLATNNSPQEALRAIGHEIKATESTEKLSALLLISGYRLVQLLEPFPEAPRVNPNRVAAGVDKRMKGWPTPGGRLPEEADAYLIQYTLLHRATEAGNQFIMEAWGNGEVTLTKARRVNTVIRQLKLRRQWSVMTREDWGKVVERCYRELAKRDPDTALMVTRIEMDRKNEKNQNEGNDNDETK